MFASLGAARPAAPRGRAGRRRAPGAAHLRDVGVGGRRGHGAGGRPAGRRGVAGQDRNPTIAFLASGGQTRVRISARAANRAEAYKLIEPIEAFGREALGEGLYGIDDDTLEGVVHRLLLERGETVAVAESLTGGLLAGAAVGDARGERDVPRRDRRVSGGAEGPVARRQRRRPRCGDRGDGRADGCGSARAARRDVGACRPPASPGRPSPKGIRSARCISGSPARTAPQTRHVQLPGDRPLVRMLSVVQALDLLRRSAEHDCVPDRCGRARRSEFRPGRDRPGGMSQGLAVVVR